MPAHTGDNYEGDYSGILYNGSTSREPTPLEALRGYILVRDCTDYRIGTRLAINTDNYRNIFEWRGRMCIEEVIKEEA